MVIKQLIKQICKYCKNEFISSHKHRFYCSKKCYEQNRQKWKKKYNKKWAKENPEKVRKIAKKWRQSEKGKKNNKIYCQKNKKKLRKMINLWICNRRLELINILGGKCQKCGYNKYNKVLQFHHINPAKKESSDDWKRKSFDISSIILLCSNCHIEEHIKLRTEAISQSMNTA